MINYFKKIKKQNAISQENVINSKSITATNQAFSSIKSLNTNSAIKSTIKNFSNEKNESYGDMQVLKTDNTFLNSKKLSTTSDYKSNIGTSSENNLKNSSKFETLDAQYESLSKKNKVSATNLSLDEIYEYVENKILSDMKC